jgi:hypothetical protein
MYRTVHHWISRSKEDGGKARRKHLVVVGRLSAAGFGSNCVSAEDLVHEDARVALGLVPGEDCPGEAAAAQHEYSDHGVRLQLQEVVVKELPRVETLVVEADPPQTLFPATERDGDAELHGEEAAPAGFFAISETNA